MKKNEFDEKEYESLIEQLLKDLTRIPKPIRKKIEAELRELLDFIRNRRPPRFMVYGRRGSGKSTLINAILGKEKRRVSSVNPGTGAATWVDYQKDGKEIEILDTRGVQEGKKPEEEDSAETALESLKNAIKEKCPDVILLLVKAKEVESAIKGDLEALEEIHAFIKETYDREVPILAVVNQCDELDPPDIRNLPTDDAEKNQNINDAIDSLRSHLESSKHIYKHLVDVVPVASYVRFKGDGTPDLKRDYRWNIDHLTELLVDELPKEAAMDFARLTNVKKFQKKVALRVVDGYAAVCGVIGAQPFPFADFPILTSLQTSMICVIGYISGRPLTMDAAKDFLTAAGFNAVTGIAIRESVRAIIRIVKPGPGHLISGVIAAGVTRLIGNAAVAYFIDEIDLEELKRKLKTKKLGAKKEA